LRLYAESIKLKRLLQAGEARSAALVRSERDSSGTTRRRVNEMNAPRVMERIARREWAQAQVRKHAVRAREAARPNLWDIRIANIGEKKPLGWC
jgi:hypothetical protein